VRNSQAQLFSSTFVVLISAGLCSLWWNQCEETLFCVSVLAPPCTSSSGGEGSVEAACCSKISITVHHCILRITPCFILILNIKLLSEWIMEVLIKDDTHCVMCFATA
jgi:hypothetical protein